MDAGNSETSMSPSPYSDELLQWVFFAIAALFLLAQMVLGWKRGVARQLVHLLALFFSLVAAWFCAPLLVPFLRRTGYPDMALSLVAGVAIWLVVFLVITLIGTLLFKKTSQQGLASFVLCTAWLERPRDGFRAGFCFGRRDGDSYAWHHRAERNCGRSCRCREASK